MTARKPGPQPKAPGFITIIIGPTLGSVVLLRQIVFTTSRGTTPKAQMGQPNGPDVRSDWSQHNLVARGLLAARPRGQRLVLGLSVSCLASLGWHFHCPQFGRSGRMRDYAWTSIPRAAAIDSAPSSIGRLTVGRAAVGEVPPFKEPYPSRPFAARVLYWVFLSPHYRSAGVPS